jgi:hypothetical protein
MAFQRAEYLVDTSMEWEWCLANIPDCKFVVLGVMFLPADTAGRALGFRIDPAVSGTIVTVSNLETGQVIRQIPDEVVVRVAHSIEKMKGLLFDGKL